jgi:hypothetical protein
MKKITVTTIDDTDVMTIDEILKAVDVLLYLEGLELEIGSGEDGISQIGLQRIKDKR